MARTARAIDNSEKIYMDKLRREGWSWKDIAIHCGRDQKRTEQAVADYLCRYREVRREDADLKYSVLNDSGPKLRCRCCGNLVTRVCKSDPRKCVVCDMRQQSQSVTKKTGANDEHYTEASV